MKSSKIHTKFYIRILIQVLIMIIKKKAKLNVHLRDG